MKTVAVLGGGIGGLAASYYLCKSPQVTKVVLLESSSRFGGWLWSKRRSDGAIFELGPRGIRPAGAVGCNTLNMVDELGLEKEILPVPYSHVASKNRFLFVNGRLNKMPSGLRGIFQTVPPFSKPLAFSLMGEILVKKSPKEDESIHSFVSRRLGKELADIAVDSLCRGVFAGDSKKLSVRSCFPPLHSAEQERGSLTLGLLLGSGSGPEVRPGPLADRSRRESWAQWSLRRGVEALPEALSEHLTQSGRVELHKHTAVTHIVPSASGWEVHVPGGVFHADHVFSALPAQVLSNVLPPSCKPLETLLKNICSVSVAVVSLEYEDCNLPVTGFGHLLPSWEDPGLLGVVYDSVPFPEHNRPHGQTTRLTVMMGGAWFPEVFGAPETVPAETLLTKATEAVRRHLGVTAPPVWTHVSLHQDCLPQYLLGHTQTVGSLRRFIQENHLPLSLVGSSYDGVSVNDVIFNARKAVGDLLD